LRAAASSIRKNPFGAVIDIGNLAACRLRVAGRIDSYVKVGNPLEGNPFVHCPTFDWEVTGADLLEAGSLRLELGGTELFLAIERVTDAALPRDVSGSLQIEPNNGPHVRIGFTKAHKKRPRFITRNKALEVSSGITVAPLPAGSCNQPGVR
jgi:hypothetical protein